MLKSLIILPDGTEIFSGDGQQTAIASVTMISSVNSGQTLTVGSACSTSLEMKLYCPHSPDIAAGTEFSYWQVDDNGKRRKIGLFTMEKPVRSGSGSYKITAYDRVSWLDKDLTQWLAALDGWPYPADVFAQMVCDACGVQLKPICEVEYHFRQIYGTGFLSGNCNHPCKTENGVLHILPDWVYPTVTQADGVLWLKQPGDALDIGQYPVYAISGDGITGRQLIRWIGEILGRFCRATSDGQIEFAWYERTGIRLTPSGDFAYRGGSLSYEDFTTCPIDKVQIQQGSQDVGTVYPADATGTNTYRITGNPMLPSPAQLPAMELWYLLHHVQYTPCKVAVSAELGIKAGDIITVEDGQKSICVYAMTVTERGQIATIECFGTYRLDSTTAVNSQSYRALSGKVLNLQTDVDGLRVENKDTAGKLATLELTVDGISTTVQTQGDKIGTLESSIEQTDSKIDMRVSEITVGGRNLFRGTGTEITNDAYLAAQYAPACDPLIPGEVYTFSICVTPGENVYSILLHFSYGYALAAVVVPDGTGKQTLSKTFRMQYADGRYPEDAAINGYAVIFCATRQNTGETDQPIERGDTTIHWVKIEKGNKATDWSPAPEDVDGEIAGVSERTASLSITVDSISSRVSNQETVNGTLQKDMTAIQQTAENLNISVQSIRDDGVSKVTTEKGFTFDDQGLTIKQSGSEMENLLDETGMYVTRSGDTILQANNEGVVATDVSVRNYLIIGSHARFEDYESGRTACFWI